MTDHDPFEDRLRETLRSGDRDVDRPDVDAFLTDVHSGARSRRARRTVGIAAAAALVIVGGGTAAGSLGLLQDDPPRISDQATSTGSDTTSPTETTTSTHGSGSGYTIRYTQANSTVLSVTSTGTEHQWALIQTNDPHCGPYGCRSVVPYSPDGGWGSPGLLPVATDSGLVDHVGQLRFAADAAGGYDGWAFDGALLSIHGVDTDGFPMWQTVDVAGEVTNVEARGSTVYALVRHQGNARLLSSPTSRDDFTPVDTGSLGNPSSLVATAGVVAFLDNAGGTTEVVSSTADTNTGMVTGVFRRSQPCAPGSEPVSLSSASDTLWALCSDGGVDVASVRPSGSDTWTPITSYQTGTGSLLAARSTDSAVLHLADNTRLMLVTASGATTLTDGAPGFSDPTMLGFTNPDLGFAIADGVLWRTDDGGQTWTEQQVVPPSG